MLQLDAHIYCTVQTIHVNVCRYSCSSLQSYICTRHTLSGQKKRASTHQALKAVLSAAEQGCHPQRPGNECDEAQSLQKLQQQVHSASWGHNTHLWS